METAMGGVTSVGTGAMASAPNRLFTRMMKRDYVALFLKGRKKNRDKFFRLD